MPLTDGYRRQLRHEGHNQNVTYGTLTVFATFNFADNYSPVLFRLLDADKHEIGDIKCNLVDEAPNMPTLQQMHQLVARSPRAQAKFFLLMDDIVDIYLMGMDSSFIGRHRVQQPHSRSFLPNSCYQSVASTSVARQSSRNI